jgi:signal transduction histidine kinase
MSLFGPIRSFGDKIALAVTATSGLAVVVVSVLLAVVDYAELRRETAATVHSQAAVVSVTAGAALGFDDPVHGADALGALRAVPEVAAAALFDRSGALFATYRRQSDPGPLPELSPLGQREAGRWLMLAVPVEDLGERQGQLQIVYDLSRVESRLRSNVALAVLVGCIAMLLAYLVARGIQRSMAAPIDELVRTVTRVSETRDYSLRAQKLGDDELGQLTEAFNQMLSRIEQQEAQLQASHAERGELLERERAAREEAERASSMKDEFVATLSHELRTPLSPILGWVEILRHTGAQDEQTRRGIEVIDRNVRAQAQLVDDLLDMSRIVSGKVRLEIRAVDLAEVIEAAVATVRPAAEAREIRLRVDVDHRAGPVSGDPNRLQQVVWNLLSNAIKFTGRGGLVTVQLTPVGSQVEVVVSDSGKGIAPEFLPHVFERFRQEDSSTTRRHGGLGLGLAIVRQLVELHGGTVRAESAGLDLGATFTVSLPRLTIVAGDPEAQSDPAAEREAVAADGDGSVAD